jgi:hypothetical protein
MALYYKDDTTFQKYLAMSFVGETAAIALMKAHRHEFEFAGYGAGSVEMFKEVSRKKKRTPDLICRRCGQKLEVRSKGILKVAMSDSLARPFDRELSSHDWVGFLKVSPNSLARGGALLEPSSYVAAHSIYTIPIFELSQKRALAIRPPSKSADKGLERYLEWPTLLASSTGIVKSINRNPSSIEVVTDSNQVVSWIPPAGSYLYNDIRVGDRVYASSTLVAGVARTLDTLALKCPA